jgi:hypothetical protein
MGILKDQRHERFAQLVFSGKVSGSAAYKKAGFRAANAKTAAACGARLLATDNVRARVEELKTAMAGKAVSLAVCDRNTRLRWLNESAERIRSVIESQPDKDLDMAMFRELRATLQQAAQELDQWQQIEQPAQPSAGASGPVRGFQGTFESLLVRLDRYVGEAQG